MKIHEYQGKAILRDYGIPVPQGEVTTSPQVARQIAADLGGEAWVVKAQIYAGGRGKGGGVRRASSLAEVEQVAGALLGHRLVTPQTGPEGQEVRQVLIEQRCNIAQEFYCSFVIDRQAKQPLLITSSAGGMDIEEVASTAPENILRTSIDVFVGLPVFQARQVLEALRIESTLQPEFTRVLRQLYQVFRDKDCTLLEINPLVLTATGTPLALDVKFQCDDNALFRQPDILAMRDETEEDPLEVEAAKYHLNYIKLSGNIGCIVNGAGLAMATMDIIKLAGAAPANFLDVGGAATTEMVENAFRILMADRSVEAVLINIFGGILRCDVFAQGILQAVANVQITVPVIVRMAGTNVEEGQRLLAESGLNFFVAHDMADTAHQVMRAIRREERTHEYSG